MNDALGGVQYSPLLSGRFILKRVFPDARSQSQYPCRETNSMTVSHSPTASEREQSRKLALLLGLLGLFQVIQQIDVVVKLRRRAISAFSQ